MSTVSLIKGPDRYANVLKSLEFVADEIRRQIKGKNRILIKPNFVTVYNQTAATHVDAVRALLKFLTNLSGEPITIAEGAAEGPTQLGFEQYGFTNLDKKFNVRFVDLNTDSFYEADISDSPLKPFKVKIAKTAYESDFRISVASLKTHDTVIVTLALKNMIMGSLRGVEAKKSLHRGYPEINRYLFQLARIIPPHLCVIDGFVSMEEEGPANGTPVKMEVALAGTDFLATDTIGAYLMGFDVDNIGYLHYCKEAKLGEGVVSKIKIVGNAALEECKRKFKPHSSYQAQLDWQIE